MMMKRHKGADRGVVIVEDDHDVAISASPIHSKRFVVASQQQPVVQRPIATRPSDVFYAETEKANIPFHQVHVAVQETHEWENTWLNRMNEANPLLVAADENEEDDALWSAAIEIIGRDRGARNPSPTDHRLLMNQKRTFPNNAPQLIEDETRGRNYQQQQQQYYQPTTTTLFRPKAMRVDAVIEPHLVAPKTAIVTAETNDGNNNVWIIPYEIKPHDLTSRSLSPITTKSEITASTATSTATTTMMHNDRPSQSDRGRVDGRMVVDIIPDDTKEEYCVVFPPQMMSITTYLTKPRAATAEVVQAREGLLYQLAISGGETTSPAFVDYLSILQDSYRNKIQSEYHSGCYDDSNPYSVHEGIWLTLTKPTFFGCVGENDAGDPMYTLGRMTFDMFTPCNLICSLQGNFNTVHTVATVPEGLIAQVGTDPSVLRTYHIITAFTIEPSLAAYPDAPNKTVHKPIRGLLTTTGYMMSDTSNPEEHHNQRNSLWITGGTMEPNDTPHDTSAWKALFGNVPPRTMGANAKLLAMKWLLGAVVDDVIDPTTGTLQYTFTKPIGGQGKAYSDTLYADASLRVIRGHRGTLFVFSKQPDCKF